LAQQSSNGAEPDQNASRGRHASIPRAELKRRSSFAASFSALPAFVPPSLQVCRTAHPIKELGARAQIRWLQNSSASRPRQGNLTDAERPRLERNSPPSQRRSRNCRPKPRSLMANLSSKETTGFQVFLCCSKTSKMTVMIA
jgi:hypothetical protein